MGFSSFVQRAVHYWQHPEQLPRVLLLYGGGTNEHAVSVESGLAVAQGLREAKVQTIEYEVSTWQTLIGNLIALKSKQDFDVVFNLIHGGFGEGGALHALLDMLSIPYVGSDQHACSLAMNKFHCKKIWADLGFNIPQTQMLDSVDDLPVEGDLSFPCIVKPDHEGSSNGITKVDSPNQLKEAVLLAFTYSHQVLIERFIEGRELTVSVLDDETMMPIEIVPAQDLYDYHAKYIAGDTQFFCPPKQFDGAHLNPICEQALMAYQTIGGRHWGRVDFIVDNNNKAWILEVNLIPGMTSHSLVPQAAKQRQINFSQLVCGLVSLPKYTHTEKFRA